MRLLIAVVLICASALAHASAYSDAVEGEGTLLHYWKMDEAAGTSLAATTGGTALTLTGGTLAQTGQVGNAVYFDGVNDSADSAATLDFTAHSRIVVELWLKTTSYDATDHMTVELGGGILAPGTFFYTQDNVTINQSAGFLTGNVGYSYATFAHPSAAAWHHVVMDFDMSAATDEVDMWLDGVQVTPEARPLNANNTAAFVNDTLHVMYRAIGAGQLYSEGWMQHLAIYSSLTGARIAAHYTAGTAPSTTYTVLAADLWDNGYDNVATPRQSTFSRFFFTTNAASVDVAGTTDIYGNFPDWAQLHVRINGVNQSSLEFTANETRTFPVTLGAQGTTRTVEIISGLQTDIGGVQGSYIDSVTYLDTDTFTVVEPPPAGQRVVVYGDSISVGDFTSDPGLEAWTALLRYSGIPVTVEGWGVRSLFADAVDGPSQAALVAQFVADAPTVLWLAIGTNDYGLSAWTDTAFGTAYAAVLDAFHAALPNVPVYCQTPLSRTTETANGHGDTLPQYRAQITTACLSRPWAKLVDGTSILGAADLQDGLHPHEAGHAKYAARVRSILYPPRSGGRGSFCGLERSGGTFTGRIGK